MNDIIILHPEKIIETEYLFEFKTKKTISQNLFYTAEGAESFYTHRNPGIEQIRWQDEILFFKKQDFWLKNKSIAFISLGCGNSGPEKMLLRKMYQQGYCVDYFGIDSSEAMIKLAANNLSLEPFHKQFLLADFTLPDFKNDFAPHIRNYDTVVYATIGGTFGNFNQSRIAEVMSRLLTKNEYFYLDIVPLGNSAEKNRELRKRYADLPKNYHTFFTRLLEKFSIPENSGQIISKEIDDHTVDTLTCTFFFLPGRKMEIYLLGETTIIFPDEKIELMSIRAYDIASLKNFMKSHRFEFLDEYIPDVGNLPHLWQRLLFLKE